MLLNELLNTPETVIESLSIYSLDGGFYTVEIQVDGKNQYIINPDTGFAKHFRSVTHVRQTLEEIRIKNAVLVHQSPYSEMVGLDDMGCDQPMVLPLHWS